MVNSSPKTLILNSDGFSQWFNLRFVCKAFCILLFSLFVDINVAFSQSDDETDLAPPPLKTITRTERDTLNKQKGIKDRTKTALNLMETRVNAAIQFNDAGDTDKAFMELGIFHALMDDTLQFLENSNTQKGRVLDNFKRFEIGLRRFTTPLELIRREMPITHEFYVRSLLRQLRDARTKATEPLFGETVLREG